MNCNGSRATSRALESRRRRTRGDIVVYTVNYNWKILTPIIGQLAGQARIPSTAGGYMIPMTASIVVKNEPNLSGSSFCGGKK